MKTLVLITLVLAGCSGLDPMSPGGGGGDDDPPGYTPPGSGAPKDRTLAFYYGPMKLMPGESILYSLEALTGHDFGSWDWTAPEPGSQAFNDAGNGAGTFYRHCRILGGCMEHRIPLGRSSFVGTAFVLELERAVVEACNDRAALAMFPGAARPSATAQPIDVIQHQYVAIFGEPPAEVDLEASLAYFDAHMRAPELTGVSALESAGRGHCRALLTTNRFLFY
ncbi:MAG: hypothetical protein IT370_13280 [Deltaproteobacteria bacterium]|nr:hypothetical protein [Deltaproteobacteria bacterium]